MKKSSLISGSHSLDICRGSSWPKKEQRDGNYLFVSLLSPDIQHPKSHPLDPSGSPASRLGVSWRDCAKTQNDSPRNRRLHRSCPLIDRRACAGFAKYDCAIPERRLIEVGSRRIPLIEELWLAGWFWCVHGQQVGYPRGNPGTFKIKQNTI